MGEAMLRALAVGSAIEIYVARHNSPAEKLTEPLGKVVRDPGSGRDRFV